MGIKSTLTAPLSFLLSSMVEKNAQTAIDCQNYWRNKLIQKAQNTLFGQEHGFSEIKNYADFQARIPVRDYEQLQPYIKKVYTGEENVLWPGKPLYFAKTSGTTSGTKYIPISKDSISNHFNSARDAMMLYSRQSGNFKYADGKLVYLSGSPVLEKTNGIFTGRLSGIVNHHIPSWWRSNQMPSYEINCIEDWEEKVDRIAAESIGQDIRLVSGIPPWVQMYFDKLIEKTGKNIRQLFPNFSVLVHGGVNFEPYKAKLFQTIGDMVDTVETFPASEGFIAYQYRPNLPGMLLNVNSGIFFEFVPLSEISSPNPKRYSLAEVETGVNYAIIINSNAGLWGYNLGDTVRFSSLNPPLLTVTGRVKHYISAFGEHVIAEEVEHALLSVAHELGIRITEFTVAPFIGQHEFEKSCHQWFVEFDEVPAELSKLAELVDLALQQKNVYYSDLIKGNILRPLEIIPLQNGAFRDYMKSVGKLGGQNKVPRLSNNRLIAEALMPYKTN